MPSSITAVNPETATKTQWRSVSWLSALLGPAILSWWILGSYFGVDVFATLSFWGADGWCQTPQEGLGSHCFGDYAAIRFESILQPAVGPESVYPLSTRFIRIVPWSVGQLLGFQAGLIVFMVICIIALLIPSFWAASKVHGYSRPTVVLTTAIATVPFISLLDRGQILALAVPFLFGFMFFIIRNRPEIAVICLVVATAIKPQFAILVLVFLVFRYWLPGLLALLGVGAVVAVPYLLMGIEGLSAFRGWLTSAHSWSQSVPLSSEYPINLSFASNARRVVEYLHSYVSENDQLDKGSSSILGLTDSFYNSLIQGAVLIALIILILFGRNLSRLVLISAILAISFFVLPIAFVYYSAIALPIAALIFRSPEDSKVEKNGHLGRESTARYFLVIAVVTTLSPLIIPISSPVEGEPVLNLMPLAASVAWMLFVIATCFTAFVSWVGFRRSSKFQKVVLVEEIK